MKQGKGFRNFQLGAAHYQLVKSIFEASSNFNNKKPRVKRAKEKSMNKHDSFFFT